MHAVANAASIDEDDHVFAQRRLVVEHITARDLVTWVAPRELVGRLVDDGRRVKFDCMAYADASLPPQVVRLA
jgi:hypothetical protein